MAAQSATTRLAWDPSDSAAAWMSVGASAPTFWSEPTLSDSFCRFLPIGSPAFCSARDATSAAIGSSCAAASAWVIVPWATFVPTSAAPCAEPATSTQTLAVLALSTSDRPPPAASPDVLQPVSPATLRISMGTTQAGPYRRFSISPLLQEEVDGLCGGPASGTLREHLGHAVKVGAQGGDGGLLVAVAAGLPQPHVGREPVAQTFASHRVGKVAALADVHVGGLGRAPVSHRPGLLLVGHAKVAQVAQTRPGVIRLRLRKGSGQRRDLEREPGRRGECIRAHLEPSCSQFAQHLLAQRGHDPGLLTEGEQRAHLHPSGTLRESLFDLRGGGVAAAQVKQALAEGAAGGHVGTLFALCEELGIVTSLRKE